MIWKRVLGLGFAVLIPLCLVLATDFDALKPSVLNLYNSIKGNEVLHQKDADQPIVNRLDSRAGRTKFFFRDFIGVDPRLINSILSHLDQEEIEEGEQKLKERLQEQSARVDILAELAMIERWVQKDINKALDYLEKALTIEPGQMELVAEVMRAYGELNDFQRGADFFNGLLEKFPQDPVVHFSLAELSFARGELQPSLKFLNLAMEGGLKRGGQSYLKARILSSAGKLRQAQVEYKKSVEIFEEEIRTRQLADKAVYFHAAQLEDVLFQLAQVELTLENFDAASEVLAKLAEKIPNDPSLVALMDRVYRAKISNE